MKYFLVPFLLFIIILVLFSIKYGQFIQKENIYLRAQNDVIEKIEYKNIILTNCNRSIVLPTYITSREASFKTEFYINNLLIGSISCINIASEESEIKVEASEKYKVFFEKTLKKIK